tara:strand:- start:2356 stop:2682 length:327 start_codon:yes stop_codon:yes gene_type:complete
MSRNYKPMPKLWRLQELFKLSDKYPSGLAWKVKKAGNNPGDAVGKKNIHTGYYTVFVDNESYQAHRIVYYLRTNQCPDNHGIKHFVSNHNKDNRLELKPTYFTNVKYK